MLHNAARKCLGACLILDMVDNDLAAGKALGLHGIDNLAKHLLFATGVTNELNLPASLAVPKTRMLSLLAITPAALGMRPAFARFS